MSLTVLRCKRQVEGVQLQQEAHAIGLTPVTLGRIEKRQLPINKIRQDWREVLEARHGTTLERLLSLVTL